MVSDGPLYASTATVRLRDHGRWHICERQSDVLLLSSSFCVCSVRTENQTEKTGTKLVGSLCLDKPIAQRISETEVLKTEETELNERSAHVHILDIKL